MLTNNRLHQILPCREVHEHRPVSHSGVFGNVDRARIGDAPLAHEIDRRIDQQSPSLLLPVAARAQCRDRSFPYAEYLLSEYSLIIHEDEEMPRGTRWGHGDLRLGDSRERELSMGDAGFGDPGET